MDDAMSEPEELSIRIRQWPVYEDRTDPTLAELVGHARNIASRCDRVDISRGGRIIAVVRWIDHRSRLLRIGATKRDREDRQRFENFEAAAAKSLAGRPPIATVEYGSERWEIRGDPSGMILFVDGQRVYPKENAPDALFIFVRDVCRMWKTNQASAADAIQSISSTLDHFAPPSPPKADNE